MAFELGGRADKFGNRYERRYFVSLMAKVLQGGLLSVQSEPTGDDEISSAGCSRDLRA